MIAIIIDKNAFLDYHNYKDEIYMLIKEIENYGLKIPGKYKNKNTVSVLKEDWEKLNNL